MKVDPLHGLVLRKYIINEVNKMLYGSIRYMEKETNIYSCVGINILFQLCLFITFLLFLM